MQRKNKSITRMMIFTTRSNAGANIIKLRFIRETLGFLQGSKQMKGGDPIGSFVFLFLQRLTRLSWPPHRRILSWINLTRPTQIMISNRTSTYLPREGTTIAAAVADMIAGGTETSHAVGGSWLGGREEDSLDRDKVDTTQTGTKCSTRITYTAVFQ